MSAGTNLWIPLKCAINDGGMSGIRLATQAILTKLLQRGHLDEGVVRLPVAPSLERSLRIFCPSATPAEVRQAIKELTAEDDPIVAFSGSPFVRLATIIDPLRWLGHMGLDGAGAHGSETTRPYVQRTAAQTPAERAAAYRARKKGEVGPSGPMRTARPFVAQQEPAPVTPATDDVTARHVPSRSVTEPVTAVTNAVTPTVTVRHDADQSQIQSQIQNKIKQNPPQPSDARAKPVTTPVTASVTENVTAPVTPAPERGGEFSNSSKEPGSETRVRAAKPSRDAEGTFPRSDATVFVDAVRRYTRNPAWMYKPPQRLPSNAQALAELEAMMTADGYAPEDPMRAERVEALVGFFVDWCREEGKEPEPDTFKTWITTHPGHRKRKPVPRGPKPPEPPKPTPEEIRSHVGDFAKALGILRAEYGNEPLPEPSLQAGSPGSPGRPGLARTEPPPMTAAEDEQRAAAAQ